MDKVVSYCLFGDPGKTSPQGAGFNHYADRLPTLVRAHHLVWSGWKMHLYHDSASTAHRYWPSLLRLQVAGLIHLFPCGPFQKLCLSMLWRTKPIFDPQCEIVACRDVDSLPLPQDRMAVEEFLDSSRIVHTIHGAPPHGGLMGGTSSFKGKAVRDRLGVQTWDEFIAMSARFDLTVYGEDQSFLRLVVLPAMAADAMCHNCDGEGLLHPSETRGRPTKQIAWQYPEAIREAAKHSEYVGHVYPLEGPRQFYSTLNVDPVFDVIRRCEQE